MELLFRLAASGGKVDSSVEGPLWAVFTLYRKSIVKLHCLLYAIPFGWQHSSLIFFAGVQYFKYCRGCLAKDVPLSRCPEKVLEDCPLERPSKWYMSIHVTYSHKFLEIVDCFDQLLKVFGISWMRYWSFSCWRMRSVLSLGSLCLALMMAASCDSTAFCDWCVSLAWPACDSADPCHGVYAGDSPTSHKHAIT